MFWYKRHPIVPIVLIEVDSLKSESLMVLMLDLLLIAELFAKERANSSKSFKSLAAVVLACMRLQEND